MECLQLQKNSSMGVVRARQQPLINSKAEQSWGPSHSSPKDSSSQLGVVWTPQHMVSLSVKICFMLVQSDVCKIDATSFLSGIIKCFFHAHGNVGSFSWFPDWLPRCSEDLFAYYWSMYLADHGALAGVFCYVPLFGCQRDVFLAYVGVCPCYHILLLLHFSFPAFDVTLVLDAINFVHFTIQVWYDFGVTAMLVHVCPEGVEGQIGGHLVLGVSCCTSGCSM